MPIEPDQIPIMKAVIQTTYSPVLQRAMVNLMLLGIEQIRLDNFKDAPEKFKAAMYTPKFSRVCKAIINDIEANKDHLVVEIMKQYGIDKDTDCFNLYFDELGYWFKRHLVVIQNLVFNYRFEKLAQLSQIKEN